MDSAQSPATIAAQENSDALPQAADPAPDSPRQGAVAEGSSGLYLVITETIQRTKCTNNSPTPVPSVGQAESGSFAQSCEKESIDDEKDLETETKAALLPHAASSEDIHGGNRSPGRSVQERGENQSGSPERCQGRSPEEGAGPTAAPAPVSSRVGTAAQGGKGACAEVPGDLSQSKPSLCGGCGIGFASCGCGAFNPHSGGEVSKSPVNAPSCPSAGAEGRQGLRPRPGGGRPGSKGRTPASGVSGATAGQAEREARGGSADINATGKEHSFFSEKKADATPPPARARVVNGGAEENRLAGDEKHSSSPEGGPACDFSSTGIDISERKGPVVGKAHSMPLGEVFKRVYCIHKLIDKIPLALRTEEARQAASAEAGEFVDRLQWLLDENAKTAKSARENVCNVKSQTSAPASLLQRSWLYFRGRESCGMRNL